MHVSIGQASKAVDLPSKTIRYYEEIGLVVPARAENGYRSFSDHDLECLRLVSRARRLGFDIDNCRTLLALYEDGERASADVKAIAGAHLEQIEQKIAELGALRDSLRPLVEACQGNEKADCAILNDLVQDAQDG